MVKGHSEKNISVNVLLILSLADQSIDHMQFVTFVMLHWLHLLLEKLAMVINYGVLIWLRTSRTDDQL